MQADPSSGKALSESPAGRPIRVLNVLGSMNRGGIETWLMQILRNVDRERFRLDFLLHTEHSCDYGDEIRSLGSKIIPCLYPKRPWSYARNFGRALARHGPYDIVHSHVDAYNGFVMSLAHRAGVRVRIAHSHSNTSAKRAAAGMLRRGYLALTGHAMRRFATHSLAASRQAARALFGADWESRHAVDLLYYGRDLEPFRAPVDRTEIRESLGIGPGDTVIGHVGRFCEPKNHDFFLDVAAEVVKQQPAVRFLLVGDGPLRASIEQKVSTMGLADRFVFAGLRSDVAQLMLGAIDVLLFPSLWEGLPMTTIESQAAGLPCVASRAVPEESVVAPGLIRRLDLQESPAVWARAVLDVALGRHTISQPEALALVEKSRFNVGSSVAARERIYLETTGSARRKDLQLAYQAG